MSNEQDQQGGKKVRKQFEDNLAFFKGILESRGKGSLLKKDRVPNDKLDDVLDKLLEKKTEVAEENFMTAFNGLLEEMMNFNKFVAQKKKEIEKLEEAEMKKMNEKFKALFAQFEDINSLRSEAAKALKGILNGGSDDITHDANDDEEKTD